MSIIYYLPHLFISFSCTFTIIFFFRFIIFDLSHYLFNFFIFLLLPNFVLIILNILKFSQS